jgi:hypothetical protein
MTQDAAMATIKICRDSGYADRIRAYHVVLDGKKVMRISNGECVEFPVHPGRHELFLKIDWCRSNKINFSISEAETRVFDCGSSLRGVKLIFAIVYATFLWSGYLWLRDSSNTSFRPTASTAV